MSKHIKSAIILLLQSAAITGLAQQSAIGIGGGISMNSEPFGNNVYKGNILSVNQAANLTYVRSLNNWLQVGADVYAAELARKSNIVYQWHNTNIGNDGKRFDYAHYSYSFSFLADAKFLQWGNSYLYGGVAAGIVSARNYATNRGPSTVAAYSYITPDGGFGAMFGAQAGADYHLSRHFSLNAQLAFLYYDLHYGAQAEYYSSKLAYHMLVYPLTVGVRYRFEYRQAPDNKL